jgi:transposase InsO family protein
LGRGNRLSHPTVTLPTAMLLPSARCNGIRDHPIAPWSPWQNGYAERLIGSIRRECLDHIVVWSEADLRRVLAAYAKYYNQIRPHLLWTKTRLATGRFSAMALSPALRFSAAYINNTVGRSIR